MAEPKPAEETTAARKTALGRLSAPFTELLGFSPTAAIASTLVALLAIGSTTFWFFHSAPPRTLIITSGPPGSSFETNAIQYRDILARKHIGVKLKILPSQGSKENLERLSNPKFRVDVGFVQGGVTNDMDAKALSKSGLVSLGGVSYVPLLVFYRGASEVRMLSDFNGKRLVIGPPGSGTHSLALALLKLNGIDTNGPTTFVNLNDGGEAKALLDGNVDAVFLMGDSASTDVMRQLLYTPDVHLMDFAQADGYTRRIPYLTKLTLPMGSIDFGHNIPPRDIQLISPTVELIARPDLHPALSDILLEAAREVNGAPGLMKRRGEFPSAVGHEFPLSEDAARFYKSGKSFLYRSLPFWLASLVNRVLVSFLPLLVVLIPGLRAIPAIYKWRIRMLIYRRYRSLLNLERELIEPVPPRQAGEFLTRLDAIESSVNKMKVPASFGDQIYALRSNISFVRNRLNDSAKAN